MTVAGRLEIVSPEFAIGWASFVHGRPAQLYARLGIEILGAAVGNIERSDLCKGKQADGLSTRGFVLEFSRRLQETEVDNLEVFNLATGERLEAASRKHQDRNPPLRIFIFGSPRSGTSELGASLTSTLSLHWLGEVHAAPLFYKAAQNLAGNLQDPHRIPRLMAACHFRSIAVESLRKAYYLGHGSASFLDKTPGIPQILSAAFLAECFPDAKFIYLYRNGISNVLSRLVKFGGNFDAHCADWAGAINAWFQVRGDLPHYLEIKQEDMLSSPKEVAGRICAYLSAPEFTDSLAIALQSGSLEKTGAGLNKASFASTDWSAAQINLFKRVCGEAMTRLAYSLDE